MSLDDEILRRLADPEDSFTERKEAPQEHPVREAMTAFANSAIPDKPGIIYVGVKDNGEIVGGDNLDSWQRKISSWAASCFPPINVIQTVLSVGDKQILAVVVTASTARPHFAKAAYVRKGAQTEMGRY
jgi:predicted HTH transcriptional regulator